MPDRGKRTVLSRIDELMSDISSCLDADPPLPRVKEHGGVVITAVFLIEANISRVDLIERCINAGLNIKDVGSTGDIFIVSK